MVWPVHSFREVSSPRNVEAMHLVTSIVCVHSAVISPDLK